jgi:hypothetical protein
MGTFQSKFSDEERAAVVAARRTLSAPEVARRAASGRLKSAAGSTALPAFVISPSTVRDLVARDRRRHAGEAPSSLASLEPVQAIEGLRKRLLSAADHLLADYEAQVARNPSKADPERLRQLLRCAREAAALSPSAPSSTEQREASGLRPAGARGDQMPGGLVGRMLADHRGTGPGTSDPSPPPQVAPAEPEREPESDGERIAREMREGIERMKAERDPRAIYADELETMTPAEIVARATGRSDGDEHRDDER